MSESTRRALLRRGLLGGAAVAALSLMGTNRSILAADDDADLTMRAYFSARFRAIDSGDPADRRAALDLIATENGELRDFVDRDIQNLSALVRSSGRILDMQHETHVTARRGNTFVVREGTRYSWANPTPPGVAKAPDDPRAALDRRPVIQSGVGYHHTVTLDRTVGRLRVHSDAYRGLGGDSPDVQRNRAQFPPSIPQPGSSRKFGGGRLARPMAVTYFWDQAVNYCYTFWFNYNPNYWNYNPSGGDCTSFISQALANAGWTAGNTADPTAYWYDAALAPNVGTAWYNNNPQRTWILANNRGYDAGSTPQNLLRGDIVYYDWNSPPAGELQHTAMVTTIPVSTSRRLVTSHNPDLNEVDWETWMGSEWTPFRTVNLRLWTNY